MGAETYVESIRLDLTGSAVDGSASSGLKTTSETIREVYGELLKLAGVTASIDAFKKMVEVGFDFNAQMESGRLAITAMIQAFNNINGAAISFAQASGEAERAQDMLRVAVLRTHVTLTQIMEVFQTLYPAAVQKGFNTDQTVKFTEAVTQAALAMQLPLQIMAREMDLVLAGQVRAMGRVGLLFHNMGISSETLAEWKEAGTTYENMMRILGSFTAIGPEVAKTWGAITSNLKDVGQQLLGAGLMEGFIGMKMALLGMTDAMAKVGDKGIVFKPELLDTLRGIGKSIAEIARQLPDAGKAIASTFLDIAGSLARIAADAAPFLTVFLEVVAAVTHAIAPFAEYIAVLYGFYKAQAALQAFTATLALAVPGQVALTAAFASALPVLAAVGLAYVGLKKAVDEYYGSQAAAADEGAKNTLLQNLSRRGDQAGMSGNKELAKQYDELYDKLRSGQTTWQSALNQFKLLGDGLNITGNAAQADAALMDELTKSIGKMKDEAAAMNLDGLARKAAEAKKQYDSTKNELDAKAKKGGDPEGKIAEAYDANVDLYRAHLAEIQREAEKAHAKRLDDIAKFNGQTAALAETGFQKEIATAHAAYDDEIAKSAERTRAAEKDSVRRAQVELEEVATRAAAQQRLLVAYDLVDRKRQEYEKSQTSALNIGGLKAQGDDFAAQIAEIAERGRQALRKMEDEYGGAMYVNRQLYEQQIELTAAELEAASQAHGAAVAGMSGDWTAYWSEFQKKAKNGQQTFIEALQQMASEQRRWAVTGAQGALAAWNEFLGQIKTEGQAVADFLSGMWGGLASTFNTGFYDVITGRVDDLKNVFKSLWDAVAKSFSDMVTQMIERWLFGEAQMEAGKTGKGFLGGLSFGSQASGVGREGANGPGTTQYGDYVGGGTQMAGAVGGGLGNYAGAAAIGYGGGSAIGGMSGAPGFSSGAQIGATVGALGAVALGASLGSVVPIIGTIIGAIVGGLIGVLAAANTEIHTFLLGAQEQATGAMHQAAAAIGGTAMDLYGTTGGKDRAGFSKNVNKSLSDYVARTNFEIHAGDPKDIQNDYQQLIGQILPKEMLHILFGQTKTGGQDYAGISGGSKFNGAIGEDGPYVKLLESLGVTAEKVQQIAGMIDEKGADEFQKWLTKFVGVMSSWQQLTAKLSGTGASTLADLQAEADKTDVEKFASKAADVAELFNELSQYAGDTQLDHAQAAMSAALDLWNQAAQYLEKIRQAMTAEAAAFAGELQGMDRAIARSRAVAGGANPADYDIEAANRRLWGVGQRGIAEDIGGAKTTDDVQKYAAEARGLIDTVFNALIAQLERGAALSGDFYKLAADWDAIATNAAGADKTVSGFVSGARTVQAELAAASKQAGNQQLDSIAAVESELRSRYQQELTWIQQIADYVKGLRQSVSDQKDQIAMSNMSPEQQAQFLAAKMRDLDTKLQSGQFNSPDEIKALTDEYQRLASQYYGLFKDGDPNKQAAADYTTKALEHMQQMAENAYARMGDAIKNAADVYKQAIEDAQKLLATNIDKTSSEIDKLRGYVAGLAAIVQDKLLSMANDTVAALDILKKAMDASAKLFTDLNKALDPGTGGQPGTGHRPDEQNPFGGDRPLKANLDDFAGSTTTATAALDAFAQKLNAVLDGAGPRTGDAGSGSPQAAMSAVKYYGSRNFAATGR